MRGVDEAPLGTALVTGANRGLGRAIALELASRGFSTLAGMRDRSAGDGLVLEAKQARMPGRIHPIQLDVTDMADLALPEDLSIVINNAGQEGPRVPVEHLDLEQLRALTEVNLIGQVDLIGRALPILRANGGGVICGITTLGRFVPQPFLGAYRATKAASAAILESLRSEVADLGIRVVEVVPGPIDTDMLSRTVAASQGEQAAPYDALAGSFARRRLVGDPERREPPRCGLSVNHPAARPADAARRAVDAILDSDGPFRVACEPLAARVMSARDVVDDESFQRDAMAVLGVGVGSSGGS